MGDPKENAKKIILARRARFVAAAIAGVTAACSGGILGSPQPCLDVADDSGARPDADPQPCLGVPYDPDANRDTGTDGDVDADAGDAGDADAGDADTDADL